MGGGVMPRPAAVGGTASRSYYARTRAERFRRFHGELLTNLEDAPIPRERLAEAGIAPPVTEVGPALLSFVALLSALFCATLGLLLMVPALQL
jgi:hypothetical protein